MILIVGSEGAQGRRYKAILRYLGKDFCCIDMGKFIQSEVIRNKVTGIIIATPTDTHPDLIRQYLIYRKPMLVEKPICKDVIDLQNILLEAAASSVPLTMMFQYRQLVEPGTKGLSSYNYFRHGNDGLIWDCLQIIGLAKSEVRLSEESPVWTCFINGEALDISEMDMAYVLEIQSWMGQKNILPIGKLIEIHQRTAEFERQRQ